MVQLRVKDPQDPAQYVTQTHTRTNIPKIDVMRTLKRREKANDTFSVETTFKVPITLLLAICGTQLKIDQQIEEMLSILLWLAHWSHLFTD